MTQNSSTSNNSLDRCRTIKTIELIINILIEISFFIIIYVNKDIRASVFGNKLIFTLCAIAWIALLVSFVFILIDFLSLRNVTSDNLELSHTAFNDILTGLPNRHSIDLLIRIQDSESISQIGCVLIRLSNIYDINDKYGHEIGDALIRDFCQLLVSVGSDFGFTGRNGGNDYLCVFEQCTMDNINQFMHALNEQIKMYNHDHITAPIYINYNYVLNSIEQKATISDLLTIVYRKIEDSPLV